MRIQKLNRWILHLVEHVLQNLLEILEVSNNTK